MNLLEVLAVASDALDKNAVTVLAERLSVLAPNVNTPLEREFVKQLVTALGLLVVGKEIEDLSARVDASRPSAVSSSKQ